jgi:hypothetical protein
MSGFIVRKLLGVEVLPGSTNTGFGVTPKQHQVTATRKKMEET